MKYIIGNPFGLKIDTIELTDDSVTKAKLNADIVGIDTGTGKMNAFNSTNCKSLDGSNLTNVEVGEGHITIRPNNYSSIAQGTWTWVITDHNAFTNDTAKAQNDELHYKVFLAVGTYTVKLSYREAGSMGIATIYLDDSSKGTIDMYAGGGADAVGEVSSIAVATAGLYTLKIKIATKNGSATDYQCNLQNIVVFRTA